MVHPIEETVQNIKNRMNVEQEQNEQAVPILAVHPKELKAVSQGVICAVILTAAVFTTGKTVLFTAAKIMGKNKCPSVDECANVVYAYY